MQVATLIGCPSISTLCTSIDRIWCSITSAIDFTDNQGLTAILIDIHRDRAVDTTTFVVTTEDATELTTGHRQRDITVNGSILGTAINSIYEIIGHTLQDDINITLYVRLATCTIDLTDIQISTAVACNDFCLSLCTDIRATTNITFGITTTIDVIDKTAKEFGHSLTGTIVGRCITNLVDTHISTRVRKGGGTLTITTTIQGINNVRALYGDICCRHGSSITTAIDSIDACLVATFNYHFCRSSSNLSRITFYRRIQQRICRNIVCLVTTTIDSLYVVGCS